MKKTTVATVLLLVAQQYIIVAPSHPANHLEQRLTSKRPDPLDRSISLFLLRQGRNLVSPKRGRGRTGDRVCRDRLDETSVDVGAGGGCRLKVDQRKPFDG